MVGRLAVEARDKAHTTHTHTERVRKQEHELPAPAIDTIVAWFVCLPLYTPSTISSLPMHQRRNTRVKSDDTTMMRSNNYYGNLESGRYNKGDDTDSNIMEAQNNERIAELSEQVARLKGLTIEIGNEVRDQNSLLDNMGDSFGNVGDLLQNTMRRIGSLLDRNGPKHMLYLVCFVVGVMIFLYWIMSHKG